MATPSRPPAARGTNPAQALRAGNGIKARLERAKRVDRELVLKDDVDLETLQSEAERCLRRASGARNPKLRQSWSEKGLTLLERADAMQTLPAGSTSIGGLGTRPLLLRQLYLGHFEQQHFDKARAAAEELVTMGVAIDVAHQDVARAEQALGHTDEAAAHLRLAARLGPAHRRAFHWWTLGSLLHFAGRREEAAHALERAVLWGTTDRALYQGHLAVVRCELGQPTEDLEALIEKLIELPAGQGYGRFVLGHLAYFAKRYEVARQHLLQFIERTKSGRAALAIALKGELQSAQRTLAQMKDN